MKASDVIKELQNLVDDFGDLEVFAIGTTEGYDRPAGAKVKVVYYEHNCGAEECRCDPHFMVDGA